MGILFGNRALFVAEEKTTLQYVCNDLLLCLCSCSFWIRLFTKKTDLSGADVRFAGLTPAQYGSLIFLSCGIVLYLRRHKEGRYFEEGEALYRMSQRPSR